MLMGFSTVFWQPDSMSVDFSFEILNLRFTDRDENAAKNICAVGASTVKLGYVRQAMPAIAV